MVRRRLREAVTLIEVLVVIAVIGLLIAILLPAIQRTREAAARVQCQNNLKQLGLGLHAYNTSNGKFPQAYNEYWNLCEPTDDTGAPDYRMRKSWATLILPLLEQQALQLVGARNYEQKPVHVFMCPSAGSLADAVSAGGNYKFLGEQFGLTCYLAVEGSSYERAPSATFLDIEFGGPKDGVIYRSSDTRIADIVDGASNTLMVGERPPALPQVLEWGWWAWSAYDSALTVVDSRLLPYGDSCAGPATYGPGKADNPCDTHHFWSNHPGGANWLFADGSVRFLDYSAAGLLPALATRNGGEVAAAE